MTKSKVCAICGNSSKLKYCSYKCFREADNKRRRISSKIKRYCLMCGKDISLEHGHKKRCDSCQRLYQNEYRRLSNIKRYYKNKQYPMPDRERCYAYEKESDSMVLIDVNGLLNDDHMVGLGTKAQLGEHRKEDFNEEYEQIRKEFKNLKLK